MSGKKNELLERYWKYSNLVKDYEKALVHIKALMQIENIEIPDNDAYSPEVNERSSILAQEKQQWREILGIAERILEERARHALEKSLSHRILIHDMVELIEKEVKISMTDSNEPTVASQLSMKLATVRRGGQRRFHSIRGQGWTLYKYKDLDTNKEQATLAGGQNLHVADPGTAPDARSDESNSSADARPIDLAGGYNDD